MASTDGHPSAGGGYGIFDRFEGYRTPSQEDYQRVLAEGLVVFDANVLLHLYRYSEEARDTLLSLMEAFAERFWVPHQVMAEFWRNRESTLNTPKDSAKTAVLALEKTERAAVDAISVWAKSVALPAERHADISKQLADVFGGIRHVVNVQAANDTVPHARDTNQDLLLSRLASVLAGRVGPELSEEDYAVALKEADRRAKAQEPPGYKDQGKDGDGGAGDYLVWEQLLKEAERRQRDVLFVTSDVKEDWWRKVRDDLRGPRLELIAELRSRTQRQLFMLQPKDLLEKASLLLDVQISAESVEDAERIDLLEAEDARRAEDPSAYLGPLPPDVRENLLIEIYRQAHALDWEFLSNSEKTAQYRQWIDDPGVGGILLSFIPERDARVWIKDVPMKEYVRSQEGVGQYSRYAVMCFRGPDEIVQSAFGSEWIVKPDSVGDKPMHCYATDGVVTRYVCWGPARTFRNLVGAALGEAIESKERPAIVITSRNGDIVATSAELLQQSQLAERSGIDLKYLHRGLIRNPNYVG